MYTGPDLDPNSLSLTPDSVPEIILEKANRWQQKHETFITMQRVNRSERNPLQ